MVKHCDRFLQRFVVVHKEIVVDLIECRVHKVFGDWREKEEEFLNVALLISVKKYEIFFYKNSHVEFNVIIIPLEIAT